jgi:hypothetical protein
VKFVRSRPAVKKPVSPPEVENEFILYCSEMVKLRGEPGKNLNLMSYGLGVNIATGWGAGCSSWQGTFFTSQPVNAM